MAAPGTLASVDRLSSAQARRIALGAQGLARPRPTGRVDRRHVRRLFADVGVVQIDSVNVVVRSQELPLWARLGHHDRELLPAMAADNELFEYWGHMASLIPVEHQPLYRWRMARAHREAWPSLVQMNKERPGFLEAIYDEVADRGPLRVSELPDPGTKRGPWWGWSHGKEAVEYLFWCGRLSARRLPNNFERIYDVTERIIPAAVMARPTPTEDDAKRELLALAARSLGIGTAKDLCDYPRIKPTHSRHLIDDLVEDGRLLPVAVDGWRESAYLDPAAARPRRVSACALLSPFDSLVWYRERTERIFDFHYRIEIYTPAPKRVYGYYVLPFLLGDRLVARVDVKADRRARCLLVPGSFAEPGCANGEVAAALAGELQAMAAWLGLDSVAVGKRGDLAALVERQVRR
jgi:uncharacterized protein